MEVNKLHIHNSEMTMFIDKLQKSFDNIDPSKVKYYANECIRSFKERGIPLLDAQVVMNAVLTKNKKNYKSLGESDIAKYVKTIYEELI